MGHGLTGHAVRGAGIAFDTFRVNHYLSEPGQGPKIPETGGPRFLVSGEVEVRIGPQPGRRTSNGREDTWQFA